MQNEYPKWCFRPSRCRIFVPIVREDWPLFWAPSTQMQDDFNYTFSLPHICFSFKGWENVLFELGKFNVEISLWLVPRPQRRSQGLKRPWERDWSRPRLAPGTIHEQAISTIGKPRRRIGLDRDQVLCRNLHHQKDTKCPLWSSRVITNFLFLPWPAPSRKMKWNKINSFILFYLVMVQVTFLRPIQ